MLAEIERFIHWVRVRNPTARTRLYRSPSRTRFASGQHQSPTGAVGFVICVSSERRPLTRLDYLAVHGPCATPYVLVFRHLPLKKDLLRSRVKATGQQVGVAVTPHQLRHTFATQLLNAGCRITSIQKLLGHRDLSSTLVYAKVHDHTVATDYYAAMTRVEESLTNSLNRFQFLQSFNSFIDV